MRLRPDNIVMCSAGYASEISIIFFLVLLCNFLFIRHPTAEFFFSFHHHFSICKYILIYLPIFSSLSLLLANSLYNSMDLKVSLVALTAVYIVMGVFTMVKTLQNHDFQCIRPATLELQIYLSI